jgi:hypothetical protein
MLRNSAASAWMLTCIVSFALDATSRGDQEVSSVSQLVGYVIKTDTEYKFVKEWEKREPMLPSTAP